MRIDEGFAGRRVPVIGCVRMMEEAIRFFIYDSAKILLLLFVMISVMGFLRSYVSRRKIREWLGGSHEIIGSFFAVLFGALTPFCSCSSIPIFLGLVKAGVPLGITFSFLVTSPLINEYLVVLMIGFFGIKIAAIYVVSGLIIGMVSGLIIGRMKLEGNIESRFMYCDEAGQEEESFPDLASRIKYGFREGWSIVSWIWKWVLLGVGIGALIHNFVPNEAIQKTLDAGGVFSVPAAAALGVPMYGSCAAIVPIAVVLFNKGVPLGTALTFMMAVAALSLPEAVILRRAMNLKLIAIFFSVVALGIIFTGYLLNYFAAFLI